MSSILIKRAAAAGSTSAASWTVIAGGAAYIPHQTLFSSHRQYATAKKAPQSLPGAMTFTDALSVLKVKCLALDTIY